MTAEPAIVEAQTAIAECARLMRDRNIGSVGLRREGKLHGVLTARDIVVRAVADDREGSTPAVEVCSEGVVTVDPDASLDDADNLMARRHVRRLFVVDGDRPVGVLTADDVQRHRDPSSVQAVQIDEGHLLRGDQGHTGQAE
jgi:signal-transduction protein with cAMP-binding, CBS, and nucleotidyltransferase domain